MGTSKRLPGCSPDVLLALAARRILASAMAAGKTAAQVPSLGPLQALSSKAMALTPAEERAFFQTFNTMANLFGLNERAADLLLLTLTAELDERIYSAALNLSGSLFGAPGPRIGSWLAVLYPNVAERTEAIAALLSNGPLTRYRLLRVLGPESAPLSQRELCGEPALLHHVLPGPPPALPESLIGLADLVEPEPDPHKLADNLVAPALWELLEHQLRSDGLMRVIHLHPVASRAAVPLSRMLAARLNRPIIVLDLKTVEDDMEQTVAETLREARLRGGLAFMLNAMTTGDDEPSPRRMQRVAQRWRRALALEKEIVLFSTEDKEANEVLMLEQVGLDVSTCELGKLTFHQRQKLFEVELAAPGHPPAAVAPKVVIGRDVSTEQLASTYRVGLGDVEAIVRHASTSARMRAGVDGKARIEAQDMWAAARERTRRDLGKFARRIETRYTWDDLVLPRDVMGRVYDFYTAAVNRVRVFEDWGYAKKHVRGRGLCALFLGESGTGKTMSAEIVAHSLNVDLYQVEISTVVSKWIGETERNLSQLFDATEGSDSILFFDEGDALFGKRTDVKESKDRYANMEVSYLLQRIETYDGLVILASNMRSSIDPAFLRRFQFGIAFPKPDAAARLAIWQRVFPPEVPVENLDLEYLANEYADLSGGQIRMVGVGAALLAAGRGVAVSMDVVERSYENEMHKLNRLVKETDDDTSPLRVQG